MIFMLTFLGLIIVLTGVLPFLSNYITIPFFDGTIHYYLVILIAITAIIYDFKNMLGWTSKIITFIIAIFTLVSGVLPLLEKFELINLPYDITGTIYSGAIIVIGSIALIYGATSEGF